MEPRNPLEPTSASDTGQSTDVGKSDAAKNDAAKNDAARSEARKLHETLLLAQATSNLGRRKFISALLALHDSKLYFQLGSPSIEHYGRVHFGIERSMTFEYLRVARSLQDLPRCERDFQSGKLNWSALREITKVATNDSEEEWIAFALKYPGARLRAEVRDALRKNRSRPRKDGYSLPALETRLVFELKPEEQDLASKALEKAAAEMGERLQGAEVEQKDAFLFLVRRFLQDTLDEEVSAGKSAESEGRPHTSVHTSLYTILYHKCPDCRSASLPTAEGPVRIEPEVVERVEGDARKVTIEDDEDSDDGRPAKKLDRPNPPSLVRKVHLRDGRSCSNPGCDRRQGLHAHHIVERARGGATALYNEVLICSTCHALVHAGLLRVEGDPRDGLVWTVPAREQSEDFWARINELGSVPDIRVLHARGSASAEAWSRSRVTASGCESTCVDSRVRVEEKVQTAVAALRALGFSAAEARRRLERVLQRYGRRLGEVSDEDLVKAALRVRAA